MTDRDRLLASIKAHVAVAQHAGREETDARHAYERAQSRARQELERVEELLEELAELEVDDDPAPIPVVIHCPKCGLQHVDEGEWTMRAHRTHLCAKCGETWTPCARPTVGVLALGPGEP